MERFERFAVILELIERLRAAGSWCGETHVQKSSYFLEEQLGVPLDYDFILYKHGPFSFELRDELTEMRADRFIQLERHDPYGPSLAPADRAGLLKAKRSERLSGYREKIDFVAQQIGVRSVVDLEKLATALFVRKRFRDEETDLVERILELKPHLQQADAEWALRELGEITQAVTDRFPVH